MHERILIIVTEGPESRASIREGIDQAKAHGAEAIFFSVRTVYAGPVADMSPVVPMSAGGEAERELHRQAERVLAEARSHADALGVHSRTLVGPIDDAVNSIIATALQHRCDLIVAGVQRHNALMRILTGSVVPGLITHAPVPVLVCHHDDTVSEEFRDG